MNLPTKTKELFSNPYLFLFPIGIFHSLWGLWLWISFNYFSTAYPVIIHARAMSEGFLISFACGFLMTAIQRFTESFPARRHETLIATILCFFAGFNDIAALAALVYVVIFAVTRARSTGSGNPPPFFVFILYGLLCGIGGLIMKITHLPFEDSYKTFLYEGMILFWMTGIGSRIFPMLLRREPQMSVRAMKVLPWVGHFLFLSFLMGIFSDLQPFARTLRFGLITIISIIYWQIGHFPSKKGWLPLGVWAATTSIFLGNLIMLIQPSWFLHALHLVLIMGYTLGLMMVASRVTLAHGGAPLEREEKSKAVLAVIVLVILAGLTRFSAYFMPDGYVRHLSYAAIVLIAAFGVWLTLLIPIWHYTFRHGPQEPTP